MREWSHEQPHKQQQSPEVRERVVRLVQEHRGDYSSLWAVVASIAPKIGGSAKSLFKWVQRYEIDSGLRGTVRDFVFRA